MLENCTQRRVRIGEDEKVKRGKMAMSYEMERERDQHMRQLNACKSVETKWETTKRRKCEHHTEPVTIYAALLQPAHNIRICTSGDDVLEWWDILRRKKWEEKRTFRTKNVCNENVLAHVSTTLSTKMHWSRPKLIEKKCDLSSRFENEMKMIEFAEYAAAIDIDFASRPGLSLSLSIRFDGKNVRLPIVNVREMPNT